MNPRKSLVVVLAACVLSLFAVSCFVRPVAVEPAPAYAYSPLMYNGYVVYYDASARPYYYVGGIRYWVPQVYWGRYRTHYYRYRTHYWRWHRSRGYHYRGRRYAPGHFRRGRTYHRGGTHRYRRR